MNTFPISRDELRASNVKVFEDTMDRIRRDKDLRNASERNKSETEYIAPDEKMKMPREKYEKDAEIKVSGKRTAEALYGYREKHAALLNFASAWSPGGGVRKGSGAQEESLCRISTLYPALAYNEKAKPYYDYHHSLSGYDYSDAMLFTPRVVFFKSDETIPEPLEREKWKEADVITAPAPNIKKEGWAYMKEERKAEITNIFRRRIRRIFSLAADKNAEVLILGAFGCGAFGNSPTAVASVFKEVIPEFAKCFETIEFAVFTTPGNDENYRVFSSVLL